jgi:transposase-like protein
VVTSLREGGDELLTFFRFPKAQWKTLRTTNTIVELTRFRGHCSPMGGGVHDAEESTAVPAGVPAADH